MLNRYKHNATVVKDHPLIQNANGTLKHVFKTKTPSQIRLGLHSVETIVDHAAFLKYQMQ